MSSFQISFSDDQTIETILGFKLLYSGSAFYLTPKLSYPTLNI